MVELIYLKSPDELKAYRAQIEQMENGPWPTTLFTTYKWITNWIDSYPSDNEYVFLLIRKNEPIIAFFPLMLVPATFMKSRVNCLEYISLSSHGDIVCPRWHGNFKEIAEVLLKFLEHSPFKWDYFYIQNLCAVAPCVNWLDKLGAQKGYRVVRGQNVADQNGWYVSTDMDWEAYHKSLSRNMRQSIKNKTNRALRNGGLTIEHQTVFDKDSQFWKDVLIADRNSWQYQEGTGISSPKNIVFFENLGRNYSGSGFDAWLLKIGDKPAAYAVSLIHNNKAYGIRWGFHKEYHKYSPTKVLVANIIKHYTEQKYIEYDMMGKFDDFKKKWAAKYRTQTDLMLFNNRLKDKILYSMRYSFPNLTSVFTKIAG